MRAELNRIGLRGPRWGSRPPFKSVLRGWQGNGTTESAGRLSAPRRMPLASKARGFCLEQSDVPTRRRIMTADEIRRALMRVAHEINRAQRRRGRPDAGRDAHAGGSDSAADSGVRAAVRGRGGSGGYAGHRALPRRPGGRLASGDAKRRRYRRCRAGGWFWWTTFFTRVGRFGRRWTR